MCGVPQAVDGVAVDGIRGPQGRLVASQRRHGDRALRLQGRAQQDGAGPGQVHLGRGVGLHHTLTAHPQDKVGAGGGRSHLWGVWREPQRLSTEIQSTFFSFPPPDIKATVVVRQYRDRSLRSR